MYRAFQGNDEVLYCDNVILIKSIVLKPEYRGQGLGGTLALVIAERFCERDIVALRPWPMNPNCHENSANILEFLQLTKPEQEIVAEKLRANYQAVGFKELFRQSKHHFLTHFGTRSKGSKTSAELTGVFSPEVR